MATERPGAVSRLERRAFLGLGGLGFLSMLTLAGEAMAGVIRAREQAASEFPPPDPDDLAQAQGVLEEFHAQVDRQTDQALAQGDTSFTVQIPPDQQTEIDQALQVTEAEVAFQQKRVELESVPLPLRMWGEGTVAVGGLTGAFFLLGRGIDRSRNTPPNFPPKV